MDEATQNIITGLMRKQMMQHAALLQGIITPHQKKVALGTFLQSSQPKFASYQPQSSEIFGILKQMKETFETNLADSQKEEMANSKAFEEQKAAKLDEISAIEKSLNQKRTQLAKTVESN